MTYSQIVLMDWFYFALCFFSKNFVWNMIVSTDWVFMQALTVLILLKGNYSCCFHFLSSVSSIWLDLGFIFFIYFEIVCQRDDHCFFCSCFTTFYPQKSERAYVNFDGKREKGKKKWYFNYWIKHSHSYSNET